MLSVRSSVRGSPAARAAPSLAAPAGSTATMRVPGRRPETATAMPASNPPPLTGERTTATSGRCSTISSPTVPCPATTSG
jgi:hypothetical protein